jgi:hypothetical protein
MTSGHRLILAPIYMRANCPKVQVPISPQVLSCGVVGASR